MINIVAFTADVEVFQPTITMKPIFYDSRLQCVSLSIMNDFITVILDYEATKKECIADLQFYRYCIYRRFLCLVALMMLNELLWYPLPSHPSMHH
jgi:glycopeptide antibiotics resistance protein